MNRIFIFVAIILFATSCKRDYLIDGGVHNAHVDQTTFDYIKGNPELDLFAYLIEKAGYKDMVNAPNTTVFVADNMAIRKYLNRVFADQVAQTGDNTPFTIDDIPVEKLRDSLTIYFVPKAIERKDLNAAGTFYTTMKGDSTKVTLEKRYNDPVGANEFGYIYSQYMTTTPEFIFIRRKRGLDWDDPQETNIDPEEKDKYEVIKTSGILTTTGVVHVIGGARDSFYDKSEAHTLFFRLGSDLYVP